MLPGTYFVLCSLKELNKVTHSWAMLDHPGFFFPNDVKKHLLLGLCGRSRFPGFLATRYCVLISGNCKAGCGETCQSTQGVSLG